MIQNDLIEVFEFLEREYNFEILSKEQDSNKYYKIVYSNMKIGIQIEYEIRQGVLSIIVYKCVNGQIIENPLSLEKCLTSDLYGVPLWVIENIKGLVPIDPAYKIFSTEEILSDKDINKKLFFLYKNQLLNCCEDLLNGDIRFFEFYLTEYKSFLRQLMV